MTQQTETQQPVSDQPKGTMQVELHCPRCAAPNSACDILSPQQKLYSLQCSEQYPCAWKKTHDHELETHDLMVIEIDRLQVAVTQYEKALGEHHAWHSRITQPTKPLNVFQDTQNVIREVRCRIDAMRNKLKKN